MIVELDPGHAEFSRAVISRIEQIKRAAEGGRYEGASWELRLGNLMRLIEITFWDRRVDRALRGSVVGGTFERLWVLISRPKRPAERTSAPQLKEQILLFTRSVRSRLSIADREFDRKEMSHYTAPVLASVSEKRTG
jgi:hypothetical protein